MAVQLHDPDVNVGCEEQHCCGHVRFLTLLQDGEVRKQFERVLKKQGFKIKLGTKAGGVA